MDILLRYLNNICKRYLRDILEICERLGRYLRETMAKSRSSQFSIVQRRRMQGQTFYDLREDSGKNIVASGLWRS